MPTNRIATMALVVPDYDEAIAFYVDLLGFDLIEVTALSATKRWVRVAPGSAAGVALLLARAVDDRQRAAIGNQAGGRVFLFLETDDFPGEYARLRQAGVAFAELPRHEAYGTVAVFTDPFGNRWDLIQSSALTTDS